VKYAEEPLLTLVKACTPLIDIIPNLFFYVQMVLNETSEESSDALTIDESAAIRFYIHDRMDGMTSKSLTLRLSKARQREKKNTECYVLLFVTHT